jgi:hypothetical protein
MYFAGILLGRSFAQIPDGKSCGGVPAWLVVRAGLLGKGWP